MPSSVIVTLKNVLLHQSLGIHDDRIRDYYDGYHCVPVDGETKQEAAQDGGEDLGPML